jgi:hypothetical protein
MSFIVNILHGPDIGRKGVRIYIRYGFATDRFADEDEHWMYKRLEFVKDYTYLDRNGCAVHTFERGDRSCVVHGVDASAMLLCVKSYSVEHNKRLCESTSRLTLWNPIPIATRNTISPPETVP